MAEGTPIGETTPAQLRRFSFAGGSMGQKVEAACRFVERSGRTAAIGAIDQADAILRQSAGAIVRAA
jgi:carbamate kinase